MTRRIVERLDHIAQAIDHVRKLMDGKNASDLATDPFVRAAFERFMEIISEASRHIPADLKLRHPDIPWADIANFGNHLRHAYHRLDHRVLWTTYENDLDPLFDTIKIIRADLETDDG